MKKKLSTKEVEHVARLARIELTKKEKEIYSIQLSRILDYVDILNEVNTDDVPITAQITGLLNIFRKDTVKNSQENEREDIIKQFPETKDHLLKVKSSLPNGE